MSRYAFLILAILVATSMALSCGGVAQNPTAPNIGQPGAGGGPGAGGPPGSGDGTGQVSGGGAATGEEVISGSFETLWPQGVDSLERGQLILAGQYFKSAYAQDPQSADAAIAYALVDVMRDHRRHAIFLHPGVNRLFANTPLVGHPEAFPNPFLTEDSYFLRLAALGYRTRSLVRGIIYPVLAPVDTELTFTPEYFINFSGVIPGAKPPGEEGPVGVPGVDIGGGTGPASGGPAGGSGAPPPRPDPAERSGQAKSESSSKPSDGKGGLGANPPGAPGPGETGGGTGGFPLGFEGGPMGAGGLPERQEPLSEDEWQTLIRDYRDAAARDGADVVLSSVFYDNLRIFHQEISAQVTNLEAVRNVAEEEGYALSLPLNVLDGMEKITLQFDVDDYHMLLNHYRLLDVLLNYVDAYGGLQGFTLPIEDVEDQNGDTILSPDEYIPQAPFGMLTDDGEERLAALLPVFLQALGDLHNTLNPSLEAARDVQAGDPEPKVLFYLSSFHRSFVLTEQWAELLRDIADKSSTGTSIKLSSGSDVAEVVAVFDALFSAPPADIRLPLPSYNMTTRQVITDGDGNWSSDPTFSGFFREGIDDSDTFITSGRAICILFNEEMGRASGSVMALGQLSKEAGERGIVTFEGASVNELVGTPYTVTDTGGEEASTGVLRSLYEVIPLFDISLLQNVLNPEAREAMPGMPGGDTTVGPDGTVTEVAPETGEAPGETIMPPEEPPSDEEGVEEDAGEEEIVDEGEEDEEEAGEEEVADEGDEGEEEAEEDEGEAEEEDDDGGEATEDEPEDEGDDQGDAADGGAG